MGIFKNITQNLYFWPSIVVLYIAADQYQSFQRKHRKSIVDEFKEEVAAYRARKNIE
jgi:hypothetical protein